MSFHPLSERVGRHGGTAMMRTLTVCHHRVDTTRSHSVRSVPPYLIRSAENVMIATRILERRPEQGAICSAGGVMDGILRPDHRGDHAETALSLLAVFSLKVSISAAPSRCWMFPSVQNESSFGVGFEHSRSNAIAPPDQRGHPCQVNATVISRDGQQCSEKLRLPPGFRARPGGKSSRLPGSGHDVEPVG